MAESAHRDEAVGLRQIAADLALTDAGVDHEVVRARVHEALFAEDAPTVRVGRYIVTQRVGAGGMGVVYAAYDPALDRKVAVKVLRPSANVEERRKRLLREARALAKLSHPHVVAVHDVGTLGADASASVFIAMEYVDGATLGDWIAREHPSWRTRLDVLVQAGRGLAAAHAAGLVHRDLKPDNVMVSREGGRGAWRARVMDFGLVHPLAPRIPTDPDATESRSLEVVVTQPGRVAGTRAYMAPEQMRGEATDARTDQFGFCVTVWEALHGERPFPGVTANEIAAALLHAEPRPPANADIPAWVHRALLRGISKAADDRFASMDDLLAALTDDPTRRRRRVAIVLTCATAIASAFGVSAWLDAHARDECRRSGEAITEVWNDERHAALASAIVGTELSYAEDTWERVGPRLDDYAARWAELRAANCIAELDRERTPDIAARSTACLDEHRVEFAATIEALEVADAPAILDALPAVLELPDLARCDDLARLAERRPPAADPEGRDVLQAELARARRLRTRHPTGAVVAARSVLARAEEIDAPALRLNAQLLVGDALAFGGDVASAAEAYRKAFDLAVEYGDDDLATRAGTSLAFRLGYELNQPEEAEVWANVAEAFLVRSDPEGGLPTAWLLDARAATARQQGRYLDAQRDFERSAAIFERVVGTDHTFSARALANVSIVQFDLGDFAGAEATMRRVSEAREQLFGPEHPEFALALASHAAALGALGRMEDALAMFQRALAIEERALGSNHPRVAMTLMNIGHLQTMLGHHGEALATQRRQVAIREADPHVEPSRLGKSLVALAVADVALQRYDEAMPLLRRACELIESSLGPEHAELALCLQEIAEIHADLGHVDEELPIRQRVIAIREIALGTSHADTALARSDLGAAQLRAGDTEAALGTLQLAMFEMLNSVGVEHHNTAFTLQRIGRLHHQRGELATALPLLRSALALEERADMPSWDALARAHDVIGRVLTGMGRPDEAVHEHEVALELVVSEAVAAHSLTAEITLGLADAERALDRLDDAEPHARSALKTLQRGGIDPYLTAEAELVLGEILVARGRGDEGRPHIARACAAHRPPEALRLRRCAAW